MTKTQQDSRPLNMPGVVYVQADGPPPKATLKERVSRGNTFMGQKQNDHVNKGIHSECSDSKGIDNEGLPSLSNRNTIHARPPTYIIGCGVTKILAPSIESVSRSLSQEAGIVRSRESLHGLP